LCVAACEIPFKPDVDAHLFQLVTIAIAADFREPNLAFAVSVVLQNGHSLVTPQKRHRASGAARFWRSRSAPPRSPARACDLAALEMRRGSRLSCSRGRR